MTREELIRHARAMYECSQTPESVKSALEKEFPELKGSEDERIIQFFAELATGACGGPGQKYYEELGLNYDKVMTWLESKKEQKPAKFSIGDYVKDTNYHGEPIYKIVQMDSECYICEYQGPKSIGDRAIMHFSFNNPYLRIVPKPVEWSEEEKDIINEVVSILINDENRADNKAEEDRLAYLAEKIQSLRPQPKVEWSKEEKERIRQNGRLDVCYNPEKYGLCHKVEWDEEEMEMLVSIIHDYEMTAKSFCGNDGKIMFLKAIRDGEYGLSKQEWSEEDDKMLKSIIEDSQNCHILGVDQIDWIKSLRPQYHWKPSDEQLRPLEYAIDYFKKKGNDTTYLESLLNDLNEL